MDIQVKREEKKYKKDKHCSAVLCKFNVFASLCVTIILFLLAKCESWSFFPTDNTHNIIGYKYWK